MSDAAGYYLHRRHCFYFNFSRINSGYAWRSILGDKVWSFFSAFMVGVDPTKGAETASMSLGRVCSETKSCMVCGTSAVFANLFLWVINKYLNLGSGLTGLCNQTILHSMGYNLCHGHRLDPIGFFKGMICCLYPLFKEGTVSCLLPPGNAFTSHSRGQRIFCGHLLLI